MDYCTPQNTDLQQHKSNLCNYKCLSYPVVYNLFNNKHKVAKVKREFAATVKWHLRLARQELKIDEVNPL